MGSSIDKSAVNRLDSGGNQQLQCRYSPLNDSYSHSLLRSITFGLAVALHLCASPAWSQISKPEAQQSAGMINGTIVDDTGAAIAGAKVTLSHEGISPGTDVLSREDGQFFFS